MKKTQFVHLHNYSEYTIGKSILQVSNGNSSLEFLPQLKKSDGTAVAITDHMNMSCAVEFYRSAKETGIKPIIGCELLVDEPAGQPGNIILLATDTIGYGNLVHILSQAHINNPPDKAIADKKVLASHAEGLIALSGGTGSYLAALCANEHLKKACRCASEYQDIFGRGNYYIELVKHGFLEEDLRIKGLLEIARRTGIPLVATNECRYFQKEDFLRYSIWENHSKHPSRYYDPKVWHENINYTYYFKTAEEMREMFHHIPQALKNTVAIAEKCHLQMPAAPGSPISEVKSGVRSPLENLCVQELANKLDGNIPPHYRRRLAHECALLDAYGQAEELIILYELMRYAEEQAIACFAKSISCGSLAAYSLGIVRLNPFETGEAFERFLNRKTLSLCVYAPAKAEPILREYLRKKYGANGAVKSFCIGKALVDQLCPVRHDPVWRAEKIIAVDGTNSSSIFCDTGAVPLPLSKSKKGEIIAQYPSESLKAIGIPNINMDLVPTPQLNEFQTVRPLLRKRHDTILSLDDIPLDDARTYKMLCNGDAPDFLLNKYAKEILKRLKPSGCGDLCVVLALSTPHGMRLGILDSLIEHKHAKQSPEYPDKRLEPILKETYGILVYQEQIADIAEKLAGFSPAKSWEFVRGIFASGIHCRKDFIRGCVKNRVTRTVARMLFTQVSEAAIYCVSKSTCIHRALLAYRVSYIKAHFPKELEKSFRNGRSGI